MVLSASWIFILAFMVESCLCSGKSDNGETKWGKEDKKKTEVFPEFYDNYQITGPRLSSSETASALVCIHKCQRHNLCNVVNIRQKSGSKVECVLASFGSCFYGSERKLQKSNGWQLYFLHEKNCDNVKVRRLITQVFMRALGFDFSLSVFHFCAIIDFSPTFIPLNANLLKTCLKCVLKRASCCWAFCVFILICFGDGKIFWPKF